MSAVARLVEEVKSASEALRSTTLSLGREGLQISLDVPEAKHVKDVFGKIGTSALQQWLLRVCFRQVRTCFFLQGA